MKHIRNIFHIGAALALLGVAFASARPARAAGTTITVDVTTDNSDVTLLYSNGTCSLREAIDAANNNGVTPAGNDCPQGSATDIDTIAFNISGAGIHTITIPNVLAVTDKLIIDGTTQPTYAGTPLIRVDGTGTVYELLTISGASADGSMVKGMMLTDANFYITEVTSDNVTFVANYIDTDGTGNFGTGMGIHIFASSNNTIGGPTAADRNLIGAATGIYIDGDSTGNVVEGNYLGLATNGSTLLSGGSPQYGILMEINGGFLPNANTIRGNVIGVYQRGISLHEQVHHITIAGNHIGVGADGITDLGTSSDGIELYGSSSNTIGGTTATDRNIISGYSTGINISDSPSFGSDSNKITGNYIGTNVAGEVAVDNSALAGVYIVSGDNNQIGGSAAGEGNLISGVGDYGILVQGGTGTTILGNMIGTDDDGQEAVSNGYGIFIDNAIVNVGDGTTPGKNLISGNGHTGIGVSNPGAIGTTIVGNRIGTNLAGSGTIANGSGTSTDAGIFINSGASAQIANNWIAANINKGVGISATSAVAAGSNGNCFIGNVTHGVFSANTSVTAPFSGNWWGNASGPTHSGNPGGTGDASSDNVDYSGFLTQLPAGCGAGAQLSSASFNFGSQLAGSSSALQTLTLTNNGVLTLNFTSATISAPYSLDGSGTCPTGAGTLAVGAACTFKIKFSPVAAGAFPRNLVINTNAGASPQTVPLSGSGVAGTQLLKNASFDLDANKDLKPDNWVLALFNPATDKRDCVVKRSGSCSFKLVGNNKVKTITQTIMKSGIAGDDLVFSLWSRSQAVPAGAMYRLTVSLYNGAALVSTKNLNFTTGTHNFLKVSGSMVSPGVFNKVVYRITFKAASGTAWFDLGSLTWAH